MGNTSEDRTADERLEDCLTLAELGDAFTLQELFILTQDGLLEKWMADRLLEAQAAMMARARELGGDATLLMLCDLLGLDVMRLPEMEAGQVLRAARRERETERQERECGGDGVIVRNQAELVETMADANVRKVYLYDGVYSIPLRWPRMTYDGRGNALIDIWAKGEDTFLDFDESEIYFYNLTIVFRFLEPRQVKMECSKHNNNRVLFLRESRVAQDGSVRPQDLAALLAGRAPFETAEEFAGRAERFRGAIVGQANLYAADYDLWQEAFALRPHWRARFIEPLRRHVGGEKLTFRVPCAEAKELFGQERAQLLYADFATAGDEAVIARLYLWTDGGKGKQIPVGLRQMTSREFGAGSGLAGYGLNLIGVKAR